MNDHIQGILGGSVLGLGVLGMIGVPLGALINVIIENIPYLCLMVVGILILCFRGNKKSPNQLNDHWGMEERPSSDVS